LEAVNFYFARDVSRFGNEMEGSARKSYRESFPGVKSKSEPFLDELQKKFCTSEPLGGADGERWCCAEGSSARREDCIHFLS
jgi:hypothetical protein